MATTLLYFYNDIQKDQHPEFMKTILKKYKEESLEETFAGFAEAVFANVFYKCR
jgi:hypothetical protein